MKNIEINCRRHIAIIVVGIFILSLICWINFTESVLTGFIDYIYDNDEATGEKKEIQDDEKIHNNMILACINRIDLYIDQLDSMWYDGLSDYSTFSKIDAMFTYDTTGEVVSTQVVYGENNWLFYMTTSDGNTIGDYEGTNRYSYTQKKEILKCVLDTQKNLEDRGIKFAIIVAPNKENIYADFVPDTYIHAELSSTDILIDYLDKNGVNIINPKDELLQNSTDFQLYYSYDTHWNQLGAYIGVRNVLDSWKISMPALSERNIQQKNLKDNYHCEGRDDLAQMIGLRDEIFNDEIEYEVEGTGLMEWQEYEEEQNAAQVSHYINSEAEVQASVLLIGDSFRTSMVPALREMFSEVYVVYRSYYTTDMLNEISPDYLIAEYVERYSYSIENIGFLVEDKSRRNDEVK